MQNIYQEIQKGAFYTFISKYSNVIIQIFVTAILARLITPEDFGIISISMVFILFFNQLSDIGFGAAIVQKKELKKLDIDTFFLLSVFQGIILSLLFIILIPLINHFYEDVSLNEILLPLSISIFFFSINTVPNAINRKKRRFKEIGFVTVITNIVTGLLAVIVAVNTDAKIYALVIKVILDAIITFALNFKISKISPKLNFSIIAVKNVFSYSLYQFFYNFLHYFSRNIDNLLIGKFLGATPLGYYDKAYRLMIMPVQNLSNVITPVLHPVLSDLQDNKERVVEIYLNLVKFLGLIGFPLSVYLFFSSKEIIYIVFGPNWDLSVIPFKYLALSVGFQMGISSSRAIFQTSGNTKALFISSLLSSLILAISITISLVYFKSLKSISIFVLVTYIISFFLTFFILFRYVIKFGWIKFLKVHLNPGVISIIVAIIMFIFTSESENLLFSFFYKTLIFILTYLAACYLIGEYFIFLSLKKIIKNFKTK